MDELRPEALRWTCDPESLGFETTAEVEDVGGIPGQPRAVAAMELGVEIEGNGFNVFALGRPGSGRHSLVREHLERAAARRDRPPDLCYVHHFEDENRPRLLRLPAGRGAELGRDMSALVEELRSVLAAAFESEEYQARRKTIDEEIEGRQRQAWEEIAEDAKSHGLEVIHGPMGLVFAPTRDEETLSQEEYRDLPPEERQRLEADVERLRGEVAKLFRRVPGWLRERSRRLAELDREVARTAAEPLFAELRAKYGDLPPVVAHLEAVEADVVARARAIATDRDSSRQPPGTVERDGILRRYLVNVLVSHDEGDGAPVVYEDHPNLANLVGRVEHLSQMGTLVTDFTLVRAGALHRACGGYLVLDADKILRQPFAWDALKRALRSGQIRIESAAETLSLIRTVTLEPEPVPLDVTVVLVGEPLLYYLLSAYDSDFPGLFKIAADFADRLERDEEGLCLYASLVAGMVRRKGLRPFDAGAVAAVIEHASRLTGDRRKLSLRLAPVVDLVQEAAVHARREDREVVERRDVEGAIDAGIHRADRLREEIQERIRRGIQAIDVAGKSVGRVNGLAVIALDTFSFGHPVRITARARLGEGEVIDIDREVELAGPIHSKGVLILQGFLGQRYASTHPLSLHASLVFEQSYGGVEGDSASLAELCVLLSAIGDVPLAQGIAITGSVNQQGEVQAVGGLNEKVEGFFDVCAARGLDGSQGVIVPASNREHLMLREDVVETVRAGHFHVWAAETVDDALERLAEMPAGEREEDGSFPADSVNGRVEKRLGEFAAIRLAFGKGQAEGFEPADVELPGARNDGTEPGDGS